MSQNRYLKLKSENNKKVKTIFVPLTYSELIEKINKEFLPNNDPNKIYQIYDVKYGKLIKDQNDYQIFNLQHSSENKIVLFVNLVDKYNINNIPDYALESSSIFFQSSIIPKKEDEEKEEEIKIEKELTEEEKIKENIRCLVQSKLKILENNIIKDIKQKILPVHNGIKCNECGINNIKGIRYKCSVCPNYNLCEKCEENSEHTENHIFLKIPQPRFNESELNQKINESKLNYSHISFGDNNLNYNYTSEPKVFNFKQDNLINLQNVTLKNNGNMVWKNGFKFKFIKKNSNYYGNDYIFIKDINPGESINIELTFDEKIISDKNEYYCCYKLIDDKSNQIGEVQKFDIVMT